MTKSDLPLPKNTAFVVSAYSAREPDILEPHEAVRKRPRMYIGDVGIPGLHHLFKEILDDAIDEVLAGHCDQITVTLGKDRSITVTDNGRGIPASVDKQADKSVVEVTMTELGHRVWFGDKENHRTTGRQRGVGAACVNALSDWMETTVRWEGNIHRLRCARGVVVSPLEVIGVCGPDEQGTSQRWMADKTIFPTALTEAGELYYRPDRFLQRIRETAYLTREVTITFRDALHDAEPVVFHYPEGVAAYATALNEGIEVLHNEVIYVCQRQGDVEVEIAVQYNRGGEEIILAFANSIPQTEAGTHITGFKAALTRVVNQYARKNGFQKDTDANFSGTNVRAGLTAIVSVRLPSPRFYGASRQRLANPELEGIVSQVFGDGLAAFFAANPQAARAIIEKVAATAQRR